MFLTLLLNRNCNAMQNSNKDSDYRELTTDEIKCVAGGRFGSALWAAAKYVGHGALKGADRGANLGAGTGDPTGVAAGVGAVGGAYVGAVKAEYHLFKHLF